MYDSLETDSRRVLFSPCLSGEGPDPEELQSLGLDELISGLHPLVVWMSNGLELLHFIQHELPLILDWRTQREQGQENDGERKEQDREKENLG